MPRLLTRSEKVRYKLFEDITLMWQIMEANVCDVNRLDSDVLLPPRKRLLACLKKQNGEISGNPNSPSACTPLSKLDTRISYLLRAHLSTDNPSQEEIVAASISAAEVAVKVAMAARAAAEEKAVIASKAMAAAKKALELVAIVDDQETPSSPEQGSKKNKQVEVQMLYNNKKPRLENGKTNDEELARKLHQAINSSPRISKSGAPSELKGHKYKMLSENGRISSGSIAVEGISISPSRNDIEVENTTNGERIQSKVKSCDDDMTYKNLSANGRFSIGSIVVEGISKSGSPSELKGHKQKKLSENGRISIGNIVGKGISISPRNDKEVESTTNGERIQSKVKSCDDDMTSLGRKRGRMKQKKLPLSICHDRDQANPKEDHTSKSSLSVGPPPVNNVVERNLWKCQAFKASPCVKQNKVMQS